MKKLIIAFLVVVLLGCASSPRIVSYEDRIIQKIIEVEKPKDVLFSLSMDWIAKNFNSAKAVIEYQDMTTGRIVGKAVMPVKYGMGVPMNTHFTLTIEVKDNKVRASVEDAYVVVSVAGHSSQQILDNEFTINECLRPAAEKMFSNLEAALSSKSSNW